MVTNKGIILLSVIIILMTITIIGASLVAFFFSVNIAVRSTVDEAKAFYLAEAGIAHAIGVLRNQESGNTLLMELFDQTIGPVALGEGTYTIKIDFLQSLIVSTGTVSQTNKTLQLQYSTL